jgi:hypothetical protein
MRAGIALVFVALALAAAPAGDPDFDALVKGIETHYGVKRTNIPMFGLVKLIVKVARPEGVKQIDLALFEDVRINPQNAGAVDAMVRSAVSDRWRSMVRVRSRDGESSYIYYRPDGRDYQLLVASFDGDEASVVQLSAPLERMAEWVRDPAGLNGHLNSQDRPRDHSKEY